MSNSLRQSNLATDAATMTTHALGVPVPMPPAGNRDQLSDIIVRAVSVEQRLDAAGRQIDDLLGKLNDVP